MAWIAGFAVLLAAWLPTTLSRLGLVSTTLGVFIVLVSTPMPCNTESRPGSAASTEWI